MHLTISRKLILKMILYNNLLNITLQLNYILHGVDILHSSIHSLARAITLNITPMHLTISRKLILKIILYNKLLNTYLQVLQKL